MRARFIYEKFTQDSDPIKDLNIGIDIEKEGDIFFTHINRKNYAHPHDFLHNCLYIKNNVDDTLVGFMYEYGSDALYYTLFKNRGEIFLEKDIRQFLKSNNYYLEEIPIKDIVKIDFFVERNVSKDTLKKQKNHYTGKKFLSEKFIQDSDLIHDMGIGIRPQIKKWLESQKYIDKYKINSDGTIDIYGYVEISPDSLINNELPDYIQFRNIINGYFAIDHCELKSLRGCPVIIDRGITEFSGDFLCSYNNLTSLEYAPKSVSGGFYCSDNDKKFTIEDVLKVCNVGRKDRIRV